MASNFTLPVFSSSEKLNNNVGSHYPSRFSSFGQPSNGFAESLSALHAELDCLEDDASIIPSSNESNFYSSAVENGSRTNSFKFEKIDKSHWKDASKENSCSRCKASFGFGSTKSNCRRCGKVFCSTCCKYKRRLSPDCLPDPQGNYYKVCFDCAERNSQSFGATRNLTMVFVEQRKNKRLIVQNEVARLVHGFQHNVDPNSRIKTVMSSTLPFMKVPEWQKSSSWMESSEVDWCLACRAKFTFYKIKHHCRICGAVFCDLCCKQNFILYYDNDNRAAKAALIGVVGCPESEPDICVYLSICKDCQEELEEHQVQMFHQSASGEITKSFETLTDISFRLEKLKGIEQKLVAILPRYQEFVDVYIYQDNGYEIMMGEKMLDVCAKLQSDISDIFTEYLVAVQGLKHYDLTTKTELKIMRNIISLQRQQYTKHFFVFKTLKQSLEKSLPSKALQQLQTMANTLAINNTFIKTRQLGVEVFDCATKYQLDMSLAIQLLEVDECCFAELKDFVVAIGDDWDHHISILKQVVKEQHARKKLIVPKPEMIAQDGSSYIHDFIVQRCSSVLYQILRTLKAKASEKQFRKTKEQLQKLVNDVSEMRLGNKKHYRTYSMLSQ